MKLDLFAIKLVSPRGLFLKDTEQVYGEKPFERGLLQVQFKAIQLKIKWVFLSLENDVNPQLSNLLLLTHLNYLVFEVFLQ